MPETKDREKRHIELATAAITGAFSGLVRALADWFIRQLT